MLAIILGLVLCHLGQSSVVPNEELLVNEGLMSDSRILTIVNASFESVADWDAWTCTRNGTDVKGTVVKRNSGGTPTNNTGPNGAKQGDYYIYYEDTGNSGNVLCKSPQYMSPWNDRCSVYFGVHMYGKDIGTFKFREPNQGENMWGRIGEIVYTGEQRRGWLGIAFNFQPSWNGDFNFEVEMSGGDGGDEGDIAFDDLRVFCPKPVAPTNSTVKPTPYPTDPPTHPPTHAPTHHTNSTHHPTRPTHDDGEVRVRFGGLDVAANMPAFEAEEDVGEVAEGVFGMVKSVVMYPFTMLHYLIYGY